MVQFREHRGGLEEAMRTCVEVKSKQALFNYLEDKLAPYSFEFKLKDLHIEHYGYDERIEWDTYSVIINGYGIVGFTNGNLE